MGEEDVPVWEPLHVSGELDSGRLCEASSSEEVTVVGCDDSGDVSLVTEFCFCSEI